MMMPEEEAFSVLVMMMGDARFRMREIFKPSMTELGLCVHQLDSLMEAQLPDLHQHFQSQVELQTKVKRRLAKFSQSRRRPLTRAFTWLKAPTSAITFKTLLRHYDNQALT